MPLRRGAFFSSFLSFPPSACFPPPPCHQSVQNSFCFRKVKYHCREDFNLRQFQLDATSAEKSPVLSQEQVTFQAIENPDRFGSAIAIKGPSATRLRDPSFSRLCHPVLSAAAQNSDYHSETVTNSSSSQQQDFFLFQGHTVAEPDPERSLESTETLSGFPVISAHLQASET